MKEPPESGYLQFSFPFAPVSLQAAPSRKAALKADVQDHLPATEFLLSGDVSLEIQWTLHESLRYETDTAPDVDNILKPLLDSMCGPHGILIDDNQVQNVSCSWMNWTVFEQRLDITLRFLSDEFVSKQDLVFVDFGNSLCFPVNKHMTREGLELFLTIIETRLQTRQRLRSFGSSYESTRSIMPIQRFFHRSRLTQFTVMSLGGFRAALDAP